MKDPDRSIWDLGLPTTTGLALVRLLGSPQRPSDWAEISPNSYPIAGFDGSSRAWQRETVRLLANALRTDRASVIRALGQRFYRGNSFDIIEDPSALTALHTLDPERSLMIIARTQNQGSRYPTVAQGQQVRGRIDVALAVLNTLPL